MSSLRLQPPLLGARDQRGSGSRDHSGLDGGFLIAQRGHTFGAGPMAPFWETEAGLKDGSKQDSGIKLIRQELDLNPRLVTMSLVTSLGLFSCVKNWVKIVWLESGQDKPVSYSRQGPAHINAFIHALVLCGRRGRRRAAPVYR